MSHALMIFKHCSRCKYIALILFCLLVFQHSATMQNANSQQKQDAVAEMLEPDNLIERTLKGEKNQKQNSQMQTPLKAKLLVQTGHCDSVNSVS